MVDRVIDALVRPSPEPGGAANFSWFLRLGLGEGRQTCAKVGNPPANPAQGQRRSLDLGEGCPTVSQQGHGQRPYWQWGDLGSMHMVIGHGG
ncbi:hypothetical protein NL676_026275 [Syzygium grande]|nr:hypothetical protein NL676_026275 [Syzygium grande]